jgi:putative two-component system response regulator
MYVRALARKLSTHRRFQATLTIDYVTMLFKAVPLHDIGKVSIPDCILLKPGKLTVEEFDIMKTHTTLGRDAIVRAQEVAGGQVPLLDMAKEIAYSHHEKWDGSGYPQGLDGDHIPVSARLMALADVYDALISLKFFPQKAEFSQWKTPKLRFRLLSTF